MTENGRDYHKIGIKQEKLVEPDPSSTDGTEFALYEQGKTI